MRRIVYLSASCGLPNRAEINDILTVSRRNNAACGVSGMLAYHEGSYFQVLEGRDAAVEGLMARIRRDPRHRNILKLWSADVEAACFPEWNMAFVAAPADESGAVSLTDIAAKVRMMTDDRRINLLFTSFLNSFRDLDHLMGARDLRKE